MCSAVLQAVTFDPLTFDGSGFGGIMGHTLSSCGRDLKAPGEELVVGQQEHE
jgi:hypothetical protein